MANLTLLKKNKFWFNLHLVLTLICCVPLAIVAVTGAIISYHDEIIDALNARNSHVKALLPSRMKVSEVLAKFSAQKGEFYLSFIGRKSDEDAAIVISGIDKDGKFDSYFLDPFTGETLGENFGNKFIGLILNLHVNLGLGLSGDENLRLIGKHIVALSTVALILLLVSGVVIYYPNFRRKFTRAFRINLRARGYTLLYQLHGSLGMSAVAVLFVISVTGLYFSYEWLAKLTNRAFGEEQIYKAPKFTQAKGFALTDAKKLKELDAVFELFKKERGENYEMLNVMIPLKGEIYSLRYTDKDAADDTKFSMMSIDAGQSKILRHARYDDAQNRMPRAFLLHKGVLNLHAGYTFGEAGKFIFCVASLLVVVFIVSGFWMSLKRIRKKGAPR
ncbi:PepSY-associated TM helix domain-containing protein [Campylobacter curvus]|uniref:PepSY-associated TM helix domain-containing protein n=1 Tax=Campylobacter curvus TaxID=200 RepID=UPI00146FF727|nr:PepSY-associated TM helix domain-containing protein [Campylobacter curvus]